MSLTTDNDARVAGVEHWTHKGDVRLFLWEKFVDSPDDKPAVLFVHGSSMASQPTFDLTVRGRRDSSVMRPSLSGATNTPAVTTMRQPARSPGRPSTWRRVPTISC